MCDTDHVEEENEFVRQINEFDDMPIPLELLRGVYGYGFSKPSLVQSKTIYTITKGKDVIVQSQAGTGKTGAFAIGALSLVDVTLKNRCQVIMISHTHELALQTHVTVCRLAHYMYTSIGLCIGGANPDTRSLVRGIREEGKVPQVVVGTPGRLADLISNNILPVDRLRVLVLDEADNLLSHTLIEQIKLIVRATPRDSQICLFSATIPQQILDITQEFMRDPVRFLIRNEELSLARVKQFYVVVEDRWKLDTLCDLFSMVDICKSIIYVNKRAQAISLGRSLTESGFTVSVITGGLSPAERATTMRKFRVGETRTLVSTDLLSRGIDVQQVTLVINYELPRETECYIHRIGRSGRFGKSGVSISLTNKRERDTILGYRDFFKTEINELPANVSECFET